MRSSLSAFLLVAMLGCTGGGDTDDCEKCDKGPDQRAKPQLCAAIRGNGQLITAHFASLARITEHYGMIDAAAGGSSASITIFMTESVRKNPNVWSCGGYDCSADERAARAALLLKSFPGYLTFLTTTEEASAFLQLQPLLGKLKTSDIEALLSSDVEGARTALVTLLESRDLRDLINPEIVELVRTSHTPAFHINDVIDGLKKLGSFEANTDRIFIRPGLLSFEALADKLGRAASFYAGYGPADHERMSAWLDACALAGVGKTWFEVARLPTATSTCGAELDAMIGTYRTALLADEGKYRSRIDDKVGAVMPALISTSVVTGASVASFASARAAYLAGRNEPLTVDFDDVKFGYFGHASDLKKAGANPRGYRDAKTAKFLSLGAATWREAISYSPAEPGLSRALELPSGDVSFGGWSDLHPTLVLKNLGCENVVYVTRRGDESDFATGVARLLGMDAAEQAALYDLDGDSAFAKSLAESDATWCTDWNSKSATDLPGITTDGYTAPMESSAPAFLSGENAYPNARRSVGLRGCTP
ncbi:MAG: hypothetical protein KF773_42495 [Deltaproteobacteria bacterium]|nr:hypothetical protein [Deltaproteobacteria bacterium]